MGFPEKKFITIEEYLALERIAIEKHEYFQGEIFLLHKTENSNGNIKAMSGASFAHNKIFSNTFGSLSSNLLGKKCDAFGSDLRINIPVNTLFTYPDISIICGEPQFTDDNFDTITNPSVLFEILSKSTRNYDLGEKFVLYRQIQTLKNYILIDSESLKVIKYSKNQDDSWLLTEMNSIDDTFTIESVDVTLQLSTIYNNVKFV